MKEMNELTSMPQSFYAVIQDGKAVMLPAEDGHWINKTAFAEAFRALEQRAEAAEAELAEEKRISSKLIQDRSALARECNDFEAKLAELDKQEPFAYCITDKEDRLSSNKGQLNFHSIERYSSEDINEYELSAMPLYARPAPAINLAELVPDYALRELDGVIDWIKGLPIPTNSATKWLIKMSDLRDDILRNIKEQSQ